MSEVIPTFLTYSLNVFFTWGENQVLKQIFSDRHRIWERFFVACLKVVCDGTACVKDLCTS